MKIIFLFVVAFVAVQESASQCPGTQTLDPISGLCFSSLDEVEPLGRNLLRKLFPPVSRAEQDIPYLRSILSAAPGVRDVMGRILSRKNYEVEASEQPSLRRATIEDLLTPDNVDDKDLTNLGNKNAIYCSPRDKNCYGRTKVLEHQLQNFFNILYTLEELFKGEEGFDTEEPTKRGYCPPYDMECQGGSGRI